MTLWRQEEESERELPSGLLLALHFASLKHRDQRRKDEEQSPYINHLIDVASILWFEGRVRTPEILMAGILHDTLEDTNTTPEELENHFGEAVTRYVEEVTDNISLTAQERKEEQVQHAAGASRGAKLIKLADKISNLRDINRKPPRGWSNKRQQAYFAWAERVMEQLRGTNPHLEDAFDAVVADFQKKQA